MNTRNITTGAIWGKNNSKIQISCNGIITMLKCVCLLLALTFVSADAWGANRTASKTGNWNMKNTWGNNNVPTAGDNVTISNGYTVTVNTGANCTNCTLGGNNQNGTLNVSINQNLNVGGTFTMNRNSTLTVTGTATINSIAQGSSNAKITGTGTLTINGGTLNCDASGFTGTLILDGNVTIGQNANLPANCVISINTTDCNKSNVDYSSYNVIYSTSSTRVYSGTYKNLTIQSGVQLCDDVVVTGDLTVKSPTANNKNNGIKLDGNTLTVGGAIAMENTGGDTRDCRVEIDNNSTLNANNIVMNGVANRNYIYFSGNGTLNVGGTITGGNITSAAGGGTSAPTSGTVNYTGGEATIGAYTYYNLSFSNTGNKKLGGNVTVAGTLTWNNSRILLYNNANNYSFTLGANATITSSNDFSKDHMFVFAKSSTEGFVTVKGNASKINTTIPVGNINGTSYTYRPIIVSDATVSGTGSLSVRSTNAASGTGNATDMQCYWETEAENIAGATMKCVYVGVDVDGVATGNLFPFYNDGSGWSKWTQAGSKLDTGNKQVIFTGCDNPTGKWSACETMKTYYSFTSGNWNDAGSWTFDPSGSDRTSAANIPASGPTENSRVVILQGDAIVVTGNGAQCASLNIYEGGILDVAATTGHDFGNVKGQGKIRIASNQFPGGTYTNFVRANGGTVEYYNTGDFTFPNRDTYNNLIINLTAGKTATITSNLTINGDLTIARGTFKINSNTGTRALTIIEKGNLTIEANGNIRTGTGQVAQTVNMKYTNNTNIEKAQNVAVAHRLELYGDFTNNGTAYFTNLTGANYVTWQKDRVDVAFVDGTKDQNVVLNGETRFYRIEVNKGSDQTYVLNIDATNTSYFKLWGFNTGMESGYNYYTNGVNNIYALGLNKGTLRLGSNIELPSMVEEQDASSDYNYVIGQDACLWIDGATVYTTSRYNNGYANSLVIYGKLKVSNSNSKMYLTNQHGFIMRWSGAVELEDGLIETPIFRTSMADGTHRGSLTIKGGTMNVTGNNAVQNSHPTFSMSYPGMSFNMSGGALNVHRGTSGDANGAQRAIVIGADPANCEVTGGTVTVYAERWTGNTPWRADINSTAPFWNLVIRGADGTQINAYAGGYGADAVAVQPLVVLNDLTISNNGNLNTQNQNVFVGGNFTINAGCTYNSGNNTTHFNGNGNVQDFTNNGTISNNGLNNLTIDEGASLRLQSNITVRNQFTIEDQASFADNQKTLSVNGNIVNNGEHYNSNSSTGCILLQGNANQTISGNGKGKFNNLHINKTGGTVTMAANTEVTGYLRLLSNSKLNIGQYNLNLNDDDAAIYSDASTGTAFNANKMIVTSGLYSDGGITKKYSSTSKFLFPYGFGTYYLPSEIQVDVEPTEYGTITSRPVNDIHFVWTGTPDALKCYWHNTSSGFSGVTSVNHYYYYNNALVTTQANEKNYIPAYYYEGQWNVNNNTNLVDQNNDKFQWESCPAIDGDFTCGMPTVFTQAPDRLYSAKSGNWNDASTWSRTAVGGAGGGGVPGANTIVVIGDETHQHTVTATTASYSGSLSIAKGSVLDLGTQQGHNFGLLPDARVGGQGTLRIGSSAYFPNGDFGSFLRSGGGTVEYYANANNITLPTSPVSYNNLKLTSTNGNYVSMPNANITVYGDMTTSSSNTSYNRFYTGNTQRTVTVEGDVIVQAGTLAFASGAVQNLIVKGAVIVNSSSNFNIKSTNTFTNNLTVYGNVVVDGALNFVNGNQKVATTFTGTRNDTIRGAGSVIFYTLTCDKGTDATPVLSVEIPVTAQYQNGVFLNLVSGTFQANGANVNINLTTTSDMTINSSSCLSTKQGTFNVCNANGNYKLVLNGKLEVLGGYMNIGNGSSGNDIEYSVGNPTIDIQGGQLTVDGQIRRSYSVTVGDLTYMQSGGTAIIKGNNRDAGATANRALFEVCNNGNFTMTGGQLTFNGGGLNNGSIADILLAPATSSATGGTIAIGDGSATANQTFYMNASSELFNLTIGTSTRAQKLHLLSSDLDVNGTLTINSNSELQANGHDVSIAGNFVNQSAGGYIVGSESQKTTFDGTSAQSISGNGSNSMSFSYVIFDNPTTVSLSGIDIYSNNYLTISSGTLDDAGNFIYARSNVINDSKHVSSQSGGGLCFNGNNTQYMSSSSGLLGNSGYMYTDGGAMAVYGNVIVDNLTEMKDAAKIAGKLTLNADLYENEYPLRLTTTATIAGNGMIILNGAIGDAGVRKYFASGFTGEFTFPIGIADNYTPATYNFTTAPTSSDGYINVKPINYLHRSISNEPTDYLKYYWMVTSEGLSGYTINHKYVYTDRCLNANCDEEQMIPQQYVDGQWVHHTTTGAINVEQKAITYTGLNCIIGDFTAGFPAYSELPTYYSNASGNWETPSTWKYLDNQGDWQIATKAPSGNPIVIQDGHVIAMNSGNPQCAYSVEIEEGATLNVGSTLGHNLGIVSGGGKMIIEEHGTSNYSFKIPAGVYDDFYGNPTSIMEFKGNHTATLPATPGNYYRPFQNVVFSGSGNKVITATAFYAQGYVMIDNNCHVDNSVNNSDFYLGGDFIDKNTTSTGYISGTSIVRFIGSVQQKVDIASDAKFYKLQINNASGVDVTNGGTATKNVEVSNILTLTNGNFITATNSLIKLTNTSSNVVSGGGSMSFVDGPLSKNISNSGSFSFPVGNGTRYGNVKLTNVNNAGSSSAYWIARYVNDDPASVNESATIDATLSGISDNEYWIITRPNNSYTSKIGLRWDSESCPMFTDYNLLKQRLKVVEYDGSTTWNVRAATASGSAAAGIITTNSNVSENNYYFTLGYTGVIATIVTTETQEICNDGVQTADINVTLSGTAPFTLKYKVDGTEYTQSGINSNSYTITRNSTQLGGNVGTYTVQLVSVKDATSDGVVSTNTGSIEVLTAYTPTFTDGGGVNVSGTGEQRTYTVESHVGSTYLWVWDGSGPALTNATTNSVKTTYTSAGTYTLKITETASTSCAITNTLTITVSTTPQPSFTAETNVCEDDNITYSTTSIAGHTYKWYVDGANKGTGNTCSIVWSKYTYGDHTVKVEEKNGSATGDMEKTITVYQKPTAPMLSDITAICSGNTATVSLNSTQVNTTYKLFKQDGTNVGNTLSGSGSSMNFTTNVMNDAGNLTLYAEASNSGCVVRTPENGYKTLTVNETPAVTIDWPDLYINVPTEIRLDKSTTGTLSTYKIHYSEGGTEVGNTSFVKPDTIVVTATGNNIEGTITVSTQYCSSNIDFSQTLTEGYVWSGKVSSDWGTAGNWYSGAVPTKDHSAVIRKATTMPEIKSSASAKSIKIESGSLTITGSNTLSVYGDWTRADDAVFYCNSSVVAFMDDATINSQTTFNSISVASGKDVTIADNITIGGDIASDGSLNGSVMITGGSSATNLSGSGEIKFNDLTVNKSVGVTSEMSLNIEGTLAMNSGSLTMASGKVLAFGEAANASSFSTSSYVDGTMTKRGSSEFTFPLGNGGRRAQVGVYPGTGADENTVFTVSYSYVPSDGTSTDDHEDLPHVSKEETWNISCSPANTLSRLKLYWDNSENSGITNLNTLVVAHQKSDGTWESVGQEDSGYDSNDGGWILSGVVSSYSPFTFGSTAFEDNPLPVTFVDFSGKVDGNSILLEWATMSELNNEHFEIERSVDGKNFVTIGFVEGAGISSERIDYQFTDNAPEYGYQYYRLLQVDYNGVKSYANKIIRILYYDNEEDRMLVAPNPSNGQFRISVNNNIANGTVQIMSQNGMLVREFELDGKESAIDISDLSNGIYFLRYISNSKVFQQKIVKF